MGGRWCLFLVFLAPCAGLELTDGGWLMLLWGLAGLVFFCVGVPSAKPESSPSVSPSPVCICTGSFQVRTSERCMQQRAKSLTTAVQYPGGYVSLFGFSPQAATSRGGVQPRFLTVNVRCIEKNPNSCRKVSRRMIDSFDSFIHSFIRFFVSAHAMYCSVVDFVPALRDYQNPVLPCVLCAMRYAPAPMLATSKPK